MHFKDSLSLFFFFFSPSLPQLFRGSFVEHISQASAPTAPPNPPNATPTLFTICYGTHARTHARARRPQAENTSCILKSEGRKSSNGGKKEKQKNFHAPTIAINERAECTLVPRSNRIVSRQKPSRRCNKAAVSLGLILIDRYPGTDAAHAAAPRSQQAQISPSPLICLPARRRSASWKGRAAGGNTDHEHGGGGGGAGAGGVSLETDFR